MKTVSKVTQWEKVFVFISSTFNDMHAERDYLVKNVFPELSEWCERRKLRMVDIDLRWGVTEADATQNKNVVNVCLNRIDDCRPFFLCFLGQRYGWVPERKDVSPETFEKFPGLEETVNRGASVTELEILHSLVSPFHSGHAIGEKAYHPSEYSFFYFRDESYVEDLPKDLPYLRRMYSDLEEQDEQKRNTLREKRKALIKRIEDTHKPCHRYQAHWSRDHQTPEIAMPLQCPATIAENQEWWRKDWLQYAGVHVSKLDVEEEPAEAVKAKAFNDRLSTGRLIDFKSENRELGDTVVEELKAAIQARFPDHKESEDHDELQREIDQQEQFVFINSEGFIKRTGDFDELDEYVENSSNNVFVLTAEAGIGKSTLLANWVDNHRMKFQDEPGHSIHFRFIGASDGSTTLYSLLRLLLKEIKEVSGKFADEIPDDPQKLRSDLPDLLETIGKSGKTIIVLDALNQLESGLSDLTWLPRSLPEGIKLIVSFKREEGDAEDLYKSFTKDERVHLVEVKPFEKREDRRKLIDAYLSQFLKELDERHIETLIDSEATQNPLFLKVVLSELRVFGAFVNLGEKIRTEFGDTPLSAFEAVLQRLELDPAYSPIDPQKAVSLIFGLIAHSRHGLDADELINLLIQALDMVDNEEKRTRASETIYLYLRQVRPYLAHRDGRYDFFYESFRLATLKRYTSEEEKSPWRKTKSWHKLLADYFYDLTLPNNRKASELPFHLTYAQEWHRLEQTLCNLDFIQAKCAAEMTYGLVDDFNVALESIPDNAENITKEKERQARLDKYTKDLVLYAKGEIKKLEVPESITPWSEEKTNAEITRIKTNPNRADRLKDFHNFLGHEVENLQKHAKDIPHLATQQAWNYADSGPVGEAAKIKPKGILNHLLLRTEPTRPSWNPLPQALKSLNVHTRKVKTVTITQDGKMALTGSEDNTCILWDLEKSKPLKTLIGNATTVAITADGKMAISGSFSKTCNLWDLTKGKAIKILKGHTGYVNSVAITSDGRKALSGSTDGVCILWDLKSGSPLKTLTGHKRSVNSVTLTPDGKWGLSGSKDWTCILWDLISGTQIKNMLGNIQEVNAVAMTPDGKWGFSGSRDKTCNLLDLEIGSIVKTFKGHTGYVNSVAITSDGKKALSGSGDNSCILWDLENGISIKTLKGHTEYVNSVAITPDGKKALSGSWDHTCILWDLENGIQPKTIKGHTELIEDIVISSDGRMALSGSRDKDCILWDLESSLFIKALKGHTSRVSAVAIIRDGGLALTGSADTTCILWDLERGHPLKTLKGHVNTVESLAINHSGKMAISGSIDKTCIMWDLISGLPIKTLRGHTGSVSAVAISPSGKMAFSSSWDHTCIQWDLNKGLLSKALKGHKASIHDLKITPDGKMAITGSADRTCILWDLENGNPFITFRGHTGRVELVKITPDGKMALSSSNNGECILWDLESGLSCKTLKGHKDGVCAITITLDGKMALIASKTTCILLDLERGEIQAQFFTTSTISTIKSFSGGVIGGNQSGETFILHASRELLCPGIGITTARQIWDFEFKRYQPLSADCPFCGNRFSPPESVLDTIENITRKAGLQPEQSPCLELPKEVWEEPGLLSKCPQCGEKLKFNPFLVDNKEKEPVEFKEKVIPKLEPKPKQKDPLDYFNQGNTFYNAKKYNIAVQSYKQAIEINPDYEMAYYFLGLAYNALGNLDEAKGAFKQAIQLKEDDKDSHFNIGLVYAELGSNAEAKYHLKRALDLGHEQALAALDSIPSQEQIKLITKPKLKLSRFENHFKKANILLDKGKIKEAVFLFKEAIPNEPNADPNNYLPEAFHNPGYVHFCLGLQHEINGDLKKAGYHFVLAVQIGNSPAKTVYEWMNRHDDSPKSKSKQKNRVTLFNEAVGLQNDEKYDEAIKAFKEFIDLKPNYALAHYFLGECYGEMGQSAKAILAFKEALYIEEQDQWTHFKLGLEYKKEKSISEAKFHLKRAQELGMEEAENELRDLMDSVKLKMGPGAPKKLEKHEVLFKLGKSYIAEGDFEGAVLAFKQVIQLKTDLKSVYFFLGKAYWSLQKLPEAKKALKQALKLKANQMEAHYSLGQVYEKEGSISEAKYHYQKALFFGESKAKSALEKLKISRISKPLSAPKAIRKDHLIPFNQGNKYLWEKEYKKAISAFKECLQIKPDFDLAYNILGLAYKKAGKLNEAILAYNKAIKLNPEYGDAYFNIGLTYMAADRVEEAIQAYKESIRLCPKNYNAFFNLGLVYKKQENYAKAKHHFQRALDLGFVRARNLLEKLPPEKTKNDKKWWNIWKK